MNRDVGRIVRLEDKVKGSTKTRKGLCRLQPLKDAYCEPAFNSFILSSYISTFNLNFNFKDVLSKIFILEIMENCVYNRCQFVNVSLNVHL